MLDQLILSVSSYCVVMKQVATRKPPQWEASCSSQSLDCHEKNKRWSSRRLSTGLSRHLTLMINKWKSQFEWQLSQNYCYWMSDIGDTMETIPYERIETRRWVGEISSFLLSVLKIVKCYICKISDWSISEKELSFIYSKILRRLNPTE